jgi:hypothetical protein
LTKTLETLETKIEGMKRSILYDINKKSDELKSMINITYNEPEVIEEMKKRDILPHLPRTSLNDFLSFEKELIEIPEMSAALVSIINIIQNINLLHIIEIYTLSKLFIVLHYRDRLSY